MRSDSDSSRIDMLPVVTLVLWSTCAAVWLIDHFVSAAPPLPPTPSTKPTEATFVDVSLTDSSPAPVAQLVPMAPDAPSLPPLPAVVPMNRAIAFAVPTPGPVRLVPRSQAIVQPRTDGQTYRQIFFGRGEGNQPKPNYPYEAQEAGQTGTVVVEFTVGTDGSVASAHVSTPCPWPLLNQAAERSIHETWTYPPGPIRHYRVNIVYAQKPY